MCSKECDITSSDVDIKKEETILIGYIYIGEEKRRSKYSWPCFSDEMTLVYVSLLWWGGCYLIFGSLYIDLHYTKIRTILMNHSYNSNKFDISHFEHFIIIFLGEFQISFLNLYVFLENSKYEWNFLKIYSFFYRNHHICTVKL